jgi:DNA-binding MarR family transcriptional regulator
VAGFWKAPRVLAGLLAERELTLSAYTLLHFLGESGADRGAGFVTSNSALADSLGLSDSTIRRGLRALRSRGLLAFSDHQGSAMFTVSTAAALAALEVEPRSALRSPVRSPETEVLTEVTSVTPAETNARKPAPAAGRPAAATSV